MEQSSGDVAMNDDNHLKPNVGRSPVLPFQNGNASSPEGVELLGFPVGKDVSGGQFPFTLTTDTAQVQLTLARAIQTPFAGRYIT